MTESGGEGRGAKTRPGPAGPESAHRRAAGRRRPPLRHRPRPRDRRPDAWQRVEYRPTPPGQRHWGCKHHGQNASSEERLVRVTGSGSGIWAARGGDKFEGAGPFPLAPRRGARGWGAATLGGRRAHERTPSPGQAARGQGKPPGRDQVYPELLQLLRTRGGRLSRVGMAGIARWRSGARSDRGSGQQLSAVRGGVRHYPWRRLVVQSGSGRLRRTWLLRQAAGPRGVALRRAQAGSRRRQSESQDMAREACTCAGRVTQ